MSHHTLSTNMLYILSGPPGSGKSTWAKSVENLPSEAVISTDELRARIFGVRKVWNTQTNSIKDLLHMGNDSDVFDLAAKIATQRMQQKLVTVIDATNTTEKDRRFWASIGEEHGLNTTIVLFEADEETLVSRDLKRSRTVGRNVIRHFLNKLSRDSQYPILNVKDNDTFELQPPQLPNDNIDVIGDIHGLKGDLIEITKRLGYTLEGNIFTHPENRKILFLGDWIDRGQESIECFDIVFSSVTKGGHFAVSGNHENNIFRAYKKWKVNGEYSAHAFAPAETMVKLWESVPEKTVDMWMKWLIKLPPLYQYKQFFFCHANLQSIDPYRTPSSTLYYGDGRNDRHNQIDTDFYFDQWSKATAAESGEPESILIRGHIPPTYNNPSHSFSLERDAGFSGVMMALKLDKTIEHLSEGKSPSESVARSSISHKTDFDFEKHRAKALSLSNGLRTLVKNKALSSFTDKCFGLSIYYDGTGSHMSKSKAQLLNTLNSLEHDKLVQHKTNDNGLSIYKYTRRVFYDGLWHESKLLLHARGLVLDPSGKIVQNPFVKVFNYGENDTGADISDDFKVEAVEKVNGFLGCVTKHPFKKNELLVTTTGSFNSDFVGYILDFIDESVKQKLLSYFEKNNETLMFEVVHPKDPHIIPYSEEEQGLYLIGARKKRLDSILTSESDLDKMAEEMNFRRPNRFVSTLGKLREDIKNVKHEGFLIRDLSTGVPIMKMKSGHYLTVKFLGRMREKNFRMMFENPTVFKTKIDEEYYPLVDLVLKNITVEKFAEMCSEDRISFINDLTHKMWENIRPNNVAKNNSSYRASF